jgi:hypothetical protein
MTELKPICNPCKLAPFDSAQDKLVFSNSLYSSPRRTPNEELCTIKLAPFDYAQDKFVFSNRYSATKTLGHKGAEVLLSLRGPKGRGNLLRHREKPSFHSILGLIGFASFVTNGCLIPIITFHIRRCARYARHKLALFFQNMFNHEEHEDHERY